MARARPLRIVALGGGVGSARLVRGLARLVPPEDLTLIVNTADDETFFGLHVSPDLDTAVYTLAKVAPPRRGWGIKGDTTHALDALGRLYGDPWFRLGDADLATHIYRTDRLRQGAPLHRITAEIARAFGIRARILPMSNDRVSTQVETRRGRRMSFQTYFVRRQARDPVRRFSYRGLASATPAPGVLAAIRAADVVVFPPSNPFTSLRPILGVREVRAALVRAQVPIVAVSPIRGGRAVRGPLGDMLRGHGLPVSPEGILQAYRVSIHGLVIDRADEAQRSRLEDRGIRLVSTDVRMPTLTQSRRVAEVVLALARDLV